jgi:hypothetical protein
MTWIFDFATSKHGFASFPTNHSQSHAFSCLCNTFICTPFGRSEGSKEDNIKTALPALGYEGMD